MNKMLLIVVIILFNTVSICQICQYHYYWDINTSKCQYCDYGCLSCSINSSFCSGCTLGYYFLGNACIQCPQNCTICQNATNCTSCATTYYLFNNSCLSCPRNCLLCQGLYCSACVVGYDIRGDCLNCANQFYFDELKSNCQICHIGCLKCTNKTTCLLCSRNYQLNNESYCQYLGNFHHEKSNEDSKADQNQSNYGTFQIVGAVCGGVVLIFIIISALCYCKQRRKLKVQKQQKKEDQNDEKKIDKVKMDKQDNSNFENQRCYYCKKPQTDVLSQCGKYFHQQCLQNYQLDHPMSQDVISLIQTQFNKNLSNSEISIKENKQDGFIVGSQWQSHNDENLSYQ